MDTQALQDLIDTATNARYRLDAALRAVEKFIGKGDLDGLEEIIDTCDAESLLEWLTEQGFDMSDAAPGPDDIQEGD